MDKEILSHFSNGFKDVFFAILYQDGKNKNYFTESIYNVTGYSPEEIDQLPEKYHSLVCDEDSESLKKELLAFESNSSLSTSDFIYRINSKSKKIVWLKEVLNVFRDPEGEIIKHHSTVFDITNIKEQEINIKDTCRKLTELNASKDKFISIVSHDLRAPFTTLLGFSEILLNEKDLPEEEKEEYIQYIFESSKTQLNLINCLLDWSRLQTGRVKVEPVRLNVKQTVANAILPLTADSVKKKIDVKIDIPVDLFMNADERLISQAVVSLVNNAIKFSYPGKTVNVMAQRFKLGMIEVIVKDDGIGISEENQNKLFKIDQKFVLAGTDGEKGSGLGLTLMKEIVDKHGGQVWFYSKVNEGSEFHFTVPEAKNIILIIEDDNAICTYYKRIIEKNYPNFDIKIVANGYEAISLLKDVIPIVIITDHDMPLMNGIQFIEALYKKESGRLIPVLVISGKLDNDITNTYLKMGIENIITKPVNSQRLLHAIKKVIS